MKCSTTPQTRRYTTLRSINARKKQRQHETCIMINGTVHNVVQQNDLGMVGPLTIRLLYYKFTAEPALVEFLKSLTV